MKKIRYTITLIIATLALLFTGGQVFADTQTVDSGAGGSATITIDNASHGQTYTVYKLFDATVDGNGAIAYTVPSGKTLSDTTYFTVDDAGNVSATGDIDFSDEAFATWAESFGTQVTSTTATSNAVAFTNLTYGYYYITSSLGVTVTVDSTNPDATVKDKNTTAPNIPDDTDGGGKKILVDGATTDSTTAKIGDTINYQIKFNATNYVTATDSNGDIESTQITSYTIADTPTNLAIDADSIKIKVGEETISSNYTATVDSSTGAMTITLTWANGTSTIYASPAPVVITYDAVVTSGAADAAATNTADISYTTASGTTTFDDDDSTTVNTYQFTLNKTDGTNSLTGAKFKLYDASTNGNEIAVVKEEDGVYRVAESGETGVAIEAGSAVIKGLKGDTTYYLEETTAPDGYNKLTSRQAVTLSTSETNTAEVVNNKGSELPSTGSFGTRILYLIGTIIIVGSLIYMITKRRVKNL